MDNVDGLRELKSKCSTKEAKFLQLWGAETMKQIRDRVSKGTFQKWLKTGVFLMKKTVDISGK